MEFDFEKFKQYVNTYDPKKDGCSDDTIIIKDMIYGIGVSYKEKYKFGQGYIKFIKFIKLIHSPIRIKKLTRILKCD